MFQLSLLLDWRGRVASVSLAAVPGLQAREGWRTKVAVASMEPGPVPDTAAFIQKMEEEKRKVEKGEVKDNRSFLAKYWMYIVPIVLFMAINGAAAPEGGS